MAQKLSALATLITTQAAGVATAMGGGTTTGEVQDLGRLLTVLSGRQDLYVPVVKGALPTILDDILVG